MVKESNPVKAQVQGPSGFIELNGQMFVVDYGKIYQDAQPIGFLFEDGFVRSESPLLGQFEGLKPIEEIAGAKFRGIDAAGMELELPQVGGGPSGSVIYNHVQLKAVNGRLVTADHKLLGEIGDQGTIYVRDQVKKQPRRKIEQALQLTTIAQGTTSEGKPWTCDFTPPATRAKIYFENEIIRYFEKFDALTGPQKNYVKETMKLWATSGLLQIVRQTEGTAALGDVKHGAAGVTALRTGFVTLDREEFEKELKLFKQYGAFWVVARPHLEVRLNLVVPHEFGHQLEFVLSQATQSRIHALYEKRHKVCSKIHPLPKGVDSDSEFLPADQIDNRCFVSGYARTSVHEYWAESVAAFSQLASRQQLRSVDPEICEFLSDLLKNPELYLRPTLVETILGLQASLRVGMELNDTLIS